MNVVKAILADRNTLALPPVSAVKEYIVAGNGLFVRAEDSRIEACIPVAPATLPGLVEVEPYARLKVARVVGKMLDAILASARRHLPNEAMYQLSWRNYEPSAEPIGIVQETWRCQMPRQTATPTSVEFDDDGEAVIDLHSHGTMQAFFSAMADDLDETGLRFYVVIGRLKTLAPEISCRVGVYGHHWPVPATTIFEHTGVFVDHYGAEADEQATWDNLRSAGVLPVPR